MPRNWKQAFLLAAAGVSSICSTEACSGSDGPEPDVAEVTNPDCSKVTAPSFSVLESGIFTFCVRCHSSSNSGDARNGALVGVNFDTYDAAKAAANLAYAVVKQRLMPYPDGVGPTNRERNQLYEWALCGTPK